MMEKDNKKPLKKSLELSFFKLRSKLSQFCGFPSFLLRTDTETISTLIPRQITHIVVGVVEVDMYLTLHQQRQQQLIRNGFHHGIERAIYRDTNMESDLHKATRCGSFAGVQELVNGNRELLCRSDGHGNVPLHSAMENFHKEVALYLVEEYPQGSYALNGENVSPLYLAVLGGHLDVVEIMFQKLNTDTEFVSRLMRGKSILHGAITTRSIEMVQLILRQKPELIDTKDEEGMTPVSSASYNGVVNIVGYFLQNFPESPKKRNSDASYAVHKACLGGHIEVLKLLHLHYPQLLLCPDGQGRTVLHLAAKESRNKLKDVVLYLLSLPDGITRNLLTAEDENSCTPLALASHNRNNEVVGLIDQHIRA